MTTIYNVRGSTVLISNTADGVPSQSLPSKVYTLKFNPDMGFFLHERSNFSMPDKLYGNTSAMADRFLHTFEDRPGVTGCLLVGEKGSGKSLVMKVAAQRAMAKGYPVIVVEEAFKGVNFNVFMNSITDACVVLFDESALLNVRHAMLGYTED